MRQAARLATASLAINPLHSAVYFFLGSIRGASGRLPEADPAYRKFLEINPTELAIHYSLGWILLAEGRLEVALAEAREAGNPPQSRSCPCVSSHGAQSGLGRGACRYTKEDAEDDPYGIADAHSFRGEGDQAVRLA